MKNALIILLVFISSSLFPQSQWTKFTLTSGFVDKNPTFAGRYYNYNNYFYATSEFIAFERHQGTTSQIFVANIGYNGIIGNLTQISNNSSLKRNPSLGCGVQYTSILGSPIITGIVIWEDNRNGRWDLYASSYNVSNGWSTSYPFDTTPVNKSSVKVIGKDSVIFFIVYEKNGDIIYREYNSRTNIVLSETNITSDISEQCKNPMITMNFQNPTNTWVSFERIKPDTNKAIYFKSKNGTVWNPADTVAYLGNNINNGFAANWSTGIVESVFESNRTGKYKIYHTSINQLHATQQALTFSQPLNNTDYSNYKSIFFPVITDELFAQIFTYLKISDSTKIFSVLPNYYPYYDSTTVGNNTVQRSYTLNNGFYYNNGLYVLWIIYSKDSLSFSNLYGKKRTFTLGKINKLTGEIPAKFSLNQNYPNPFNQSTMFNIRCSKAGFVEVKVKDVTGREVITLVNEYLQPGTYSVRFNAAQLSSGIYFYTLKTDNFFESKKMLIIR